MNTNLQPPDFNTMSDRDILVWLATMHGVICAEIADINIRLKVVEGKWWATGTIGKLFSAVGGFFGGILINN